MKKKRIEYKSPIDALVAIIKRLSIYEHQYTMDSEKFFYRYNNGNLDDRNDFISWANDYQYYRAIRLDIEKHLKNVA
ncbi:MAG: hypothetical protein KAH84_12405 [Thiomargarita sp.]|nr:hypothetical protein [Thiomargarita sp.]